MLLSALGAQHGYNGAEMTKGGVRGGLAVGLVAATFMTLAQVFQPDPLSAVLRIGLVSFGVVLGLALLAWRDGRL